MKQHYIMYSSFFKNEKMQVKVTELTAERFVNAMRAAGIDCYAELDKNKNNTKTIYNETNNR